MIQLLETRLVDPSSSHSSHVHSSEETVTHHSSNNHSPQQQQPNSNHLAAEALVRSNAVMEQRLGLLTEHVARIDNKLSSMQKALDTNSILLPQDELVAAASEHYRVGVDIPRVQALDKVSD